MPENMVTSLAKKKFKEFLLSLDFGIVSVRPYKRYSLRAYFYRVPDVYPRATRFAQWSLGSKVVDFGYMEDNKEVFVSQISWRRDNNG